MQPMRLAACLLLLAAVAAAREIPDTIEVANLPAELQVAATNCLKMFGVAGCKWGASACKAAKATIGECQLCQSPEAGKWECVNCVPGNFLVGGTDCATCPQGAWCGGNHEIEWCDDPYIVRGSNINEGITTDATGQWSPTQCSTCLPGYQPIAGGFCEPCPIGTFKPRVGSSTCSYCPDGLVANMDTAATECVPQSQTLTPDYNPNTPQTATAPFDPVFKCPANSSPPATLNLATLRSCKCNTGFAVKTFGNADVFGKPATFVQFRNGTAMGTYWPIACVAVKAPTPSGPPAPAPAPPASPRPAEWGHWQHGKKGKKGAKYNRKDWEEEEWEYEKDEKKYGDDEDKYESGKYDDEDEDKYADKYEKRGDAYEKKHRHAKEYREKKMEKEEEKEYKEEKKHEREHEKSEEKKEREYEKEKKHHKKHEKKEYEEEDKY